MTDFPNPHERETVPGYEFRPPASIEIESHNIINRFQNSEGKSFAVLLFEEGGEVPSDIAEWARYRTYSDRRIKTMTADDRERFGNVDAVKERFLKDQKGRRLYAAVDEVTGMLSGMVWLHRLEGGETGWDIYEACRTYNGEMQRQGQQGNMINPATHSTLASRIYGDTRHTKAHTPFLLTALEDYYAHDLECEGIVIRVSLSDVNAVGAFTESSALKDRAQFTIIDKEEGVAYLLNRGLMSPDDAHKWSGRDTVS